ncbi:hypothetical protein GQX74_000164, partial [Glossina fuscipes]
SDNRVHSHEEVNERHTGFKHCTANYELYNPPKKETAPNFLVISLNKNEATAQKLPSTNSKSTQIEEENWEFVENFNEILHFIWNVVHWLGAIRICSTLLGCFLIHHMDLRQRLLGARMRIACCSLIYRKESEELLVKAQEYPRSYLATSSSITVHLSVVVLSEDQSDLTSPKTNNSQSPTQPITWISP